MKILLIEDDIPTAQTLQNALKKQYVVELAHTGEEGEVLVHDNTYDVIIVDYLLPDINGIEVCKKIRANKIDIPILMLTGTDEMQTKINALHSGADDYIIKPYNLGELHARIEAVLRRSNILYQSDTLVIGDLVMSLSKKIVTRQGKTLSLRRKEVDLLEYLMRNVGRVVTRSMIFDHVWESSSDTLTNVVDVHIKHLRDQVDKHYEKKLIKTVHGYGYKIEI